MRIAWGLYGRAQECSSLSQSGSSNVAMRSFWTTATMSTASAA
jgi:hypothetical protein